MAGANPNITLMCKSRRCAAAPSSMSRTIARVSTMPTPPASPVMNRKPMSASIDVANAQPSAPMV